MRNGEEEKESEAGREMERNSFDGTRFYFQIIPLLILSHSTPPLAFNPLNSKSLDKGESFIVSGVEMERRARGACKRATELEKGGSEGDDGERQRD